MLKIDKDLLCRWGKRELRKWLDDYYAIMHTGDRDQCLDVFFRPWKHISKCKRCKRAIAS